MTLEHNSLGYWLSVQIATQVDRTRFDVRFNAGHVSRSPENYYIPDVMVMPVDLQQGLRGGGVLEAYAAPLPLVVEVWSRSTGDYDVETKLKEYQRRGDQEIWRLHPYERTLTIWRRQPDGSYLESLHGGGTIQPVAVPGVTVDLDALFE